jgi:hypothetical protein
MKTDLISETSLTQIYSKKTSFDYFSMEMDLVIGVRKNGIK